MNTANIHISYNRQSMSREEWETLKIALEAYLDAHFGNRIIDLGFQYTGDFT